MLLLKLPTRKIACFIVILRVLTNIKGTSPFHCYNYIDQNIIYLHERLVPMSILPSPDQQNEQLFSNSIISFIKKFQVIKLLRKCGFRKEKGISLFSLFLYVLSNVFRDRSLYMQLKMDHFQEIFPRTHITVLCATFTSIGSTSPHFCLRKSLITTCDL